jgi:hypothetical protein
MEKLFRDVDYYITEASNSTQREFELDFADVIEVYDTNETTITTECGRTLVITWCSKGYYQSYQVIYETPQMESTFKRDVVMDVIKKLHAIDVDGETMQYILEKVGMQDQMLRQLMMNEPFEDVKYLWQERKDWEEEYS